MLKNKLLIQNGQIVSSNQIVRKDILIENGSIDRNYQRWIGISIDYLQVIDALKNHLQDRLLWMDQKINSM